MSQRLTWALAAALTFAGVALAQGSGDPSAPTVTVRGNVKQFTSTAFCSTTASRCSSRRWPRSSW